LSAPQPAAGAGPRAAPQPASLTHGTVWRLTAPIVLSNLTQPLMGMVDTAVMGHLPDPAYIGAVALGALVFSYVYWAFGFLRMATTGFVAQAHGAADDQALRHATARGAILALVIGGLVVALQAPLTGAALALLGGSDKVRGLAATYVETRIWGAPAALLTYVALGVLIGLQRVRTVLVLAVTQNAVNAALALLFVLELDWGVRGVAAATLAAEHVGAAIGLVAVWRALAGRGGRWGGPNLFDRARLLGTLKVNGDIFLRTLCLVTAFAWFASQGARQGDVTLAANAVLMNFLMLASHGLDAFAHTAESLVGAAIGAGDRRALARAVALTTAWSAGLAAIASIVFLAAGGAVIDLSTGIADVRDEARRFLPWAALAPVVAVWCFQFDGIYIGATRTAEMRNGMALALALLLALGYGLMPVWGNHGLWLALLGFFALRGATLALWYRRIPASLGA
jgi:MATE family multidrug resistance protein